MQVMQGGIRHNAVSSDKEGGGVNIVLKGSLIPCKKLLVWVKEFYVLIELVS
jgi:hypothetical protein